MSLVLDQGSDVIKADGLQPVTITGHITDSSGRLAHSGWIEFRLQPENQSLPYSVQPDLFIANITRGFIVPGGRVVQHHGGVKPLLIWPNDLIVPANSLYQVIIAPHGRVTRVLNGVLITQSVNPQNLASLTFVNPQNQVVGSIVNANPLVTMSVIPGVTDAFTIGDPLHRYAAGYFSALSVDTLNVGKINAGQVAGLLFPVSSELQFGQPQPGQPILIYTFPYCVDFPPNFSGPDSYFTVDGMPDGVCNFPVLLNGAQVGNVAIDPLLNVTFTTDGFTAEGGDRMMVTAPDPMDALLRDPALTLVGTLCDSTVGGGGTVTPPPPTPSLNVLDYMVPPASFTQSYHMASLQAGVNPEYVYQNPIDANTGWIWYIKSQQGFPWDGNYYDQNYVYQVITEGPQGWTDPTSYKQFVSTSWPNGKGGIVWLPRTIQPMPATNPVLTSDTTYNTYLGGSLVATQNLGGPARITVQGPQNLTVGALGVVPCIVMNYQWNPNFEIEEQYWYAQGYGLVRYREYSLSGGVYLLTKDELFDQKTSGGTPALNFPNPLP